MTSQLVFGGKTKAVLPETALDTVLLSHSQTHRTTTETLLELLKWHGRTGTGSCARVGVDGRGPDSLQ